MPNARVRLHPEGGISPVSPVLDLVSFRKHMTLIATTLREAQAAVQE